MIGAFARPFLSGLVFYLSLNASGAGQSGWGVPMATDIAFTLGVLALLGSRAPLVLNVFFTALAIADDLGAVIVIALFYTEEVAWIWLLVAAIIFVILVAMNRWRVYSVLPYAILGIGLWFAFFESGIHPTIAGVLLAMTIPTRSPPDTGALLAQCISVLNEFEKPALDDSHGEERTQVAAQTLGTVSERMQSTAQRLEHDGQVQVDPSFYYYPQVPVLKGLQAPIGPLEGIAHEVLDYREHAGHAEGLLGLDLPALIARH